MFYFYADDGRILTPPKELKPMLKGAFSTFYKLLGHIRFFYMVDENWDGKDSLSFNSDSGQLAAIIFKDSTFHINIANQNFQVVDETLLDRIFNALAEASHSNLRRPFEQLSLDLDKYPNGIRCDLCQLYKCNNINNLSGCENFRVMDHHCYYGVQEGWGIQANKADFSWICEGWQGCYTKSYACFAKKGVKNCFECGEYQACSDCGVGHNPGECNLGLTADEVTKLIIPYCETERLDFLRKFVK